MSSRMPKSPLDEADITQIVSAAQPPMGQDEAPRIVVAAGGPPRTHRISGTIIVGRGVDADIQLNCAGVSRAHARIREIDGRYVLEDLESKNGTYVNGEPITEHELQIGDEIRIGKDGQLLFTRVTVLEDRFVEQQKMEAIGRLSAGIAHEFNNLLAIVIASLEYVKTVPGEFIAQPNVAQSLDDAITAASQATAVTRGLLGFSKPTKGDTTRVDVEQLLKSVIRLVRRTFERNITIELDVPTDLAVEADAGLLFQAVLNLCLNARDAMPRGGALRVRAHRETSKGPAPPSVIVTVTDTGVGMTESQMQHAFEPFFTSKGSGAGTGLGLALVYGIVTTHGGTIRVASRMDEGTTFTMKLPESPRQPPAHRRRTTRTVRVDTLADPGRVLLVDDEPLVRRSYARVIERAGYETAVASDGAEALEMYQAAKTRFGVVVLDLNMPGLSGSQTFARLRAMDPRARVVVLSGYADRERDRLLSQGAIAVLTKPCPMTKLTETIGRAMSAR
jgi:signal transduction histidine kinase